MKNRRYNSKAFVKSAFMLITKELELGRSLQNIKRDIRRLVELNGAGLGVAEQDYLVRVYFNISRASKKSGNWQETLSRRKRFDTGLKAARRVERRMISRDKKRTVIEAIKGATVFFICSVHDKCAEDHLDLQGQIYVDRFWRQKVSGKEYYAVLSYIRNHKIMTVQEVLQEPYYLMTRPNCKHYLIPLPTAAVLGSSVGKLRHDFGRDRREQFGTEQYYALREETFSGMEKIAPCKEFEKIINKSKKKRA